MQKFSTGDKVTIQMHLNDGVRFEFLKDRVGMVQKQVDVYPEGPEMYEVCVLVDDKIRETYTTLIPFFAYELQLVEEEENE